MGDLSGGGGLAIPGEGAKLVELRGQLGARGREPGGAQQLGAGRPLGDVGVRTTRDRLSSEREVRVEEGVGERVVHPAQQFGVGGGVGRARPVLAADEPGVERAGDTLVHPTYSRCGARRGGDVAERRDDEPARGTPKATDGVVLEGRVLRDTCHGGRVQGLQHQSAYAADEGRE